SRQFAILPERQCGRCHHLYGVLRAEHGGVEDQVVEARVGRITAIEPFHVLSTGPVGLLETRAGDAAVDAFDGHGPPGPPIDRPVEADVKGPRMTREDNRSSPTEDHGPG